VYPPAVFYFDLASPDAYIAAERVLHVLPGPAEWQPVLARELASAHAPLWDARNAPMDDSTVRERIEQRAHALGLQPLRWPDPFPFDSSLAMRVATYAKSIGRTVPFAQAAFRQAFAGGHSLEDPDYVLIAAAACEMHPAAVLRGAELRSVERQLAHATQHAVRTGIIDVPSVLAAGRLFTGERSIDEAAAHMREAS
jgi:2-hydroxychromene-2-carboxylate isomerase